MTVAVAGVSHWLWRRSRARSARHWPSAEATIESGAVEVVARTRGGQIELPVFAFSYEVEGQLFGGRFALRPYITDPGASIVTRLIGKKIVVRYDPTDAATWFIPDELIERCKIEQKLSPDLINYSPRT